jgi:hypothetical protein
VKRLALYCAASALVLAALAGCSGASTAVNANKISNDAQKCATLATGYAGLYATLAQDQSAAGIQKAEQTLQDIKGSVPDNIKTDLETIENGIKNAQGGTALMDFLSSDAYKAADKEITTYLTTQCNKIGQ